MPFFPTFEASPFLSEGGPFVVGQGSPGMGTSRGKIHGIWVFCKTLLPLLFGGLLIGVPWIENFPSPKIRLVREVFAMLMDSSFDPVFKGLIVTCWFKSNHQLLQPLWKPLEVSSAYHACLFIISGQFGQLLESRRVFVQFPSFHLEFEEFFLGFFLAHYILEILGEVIDHSVPDPFI